MSLHIDFIKFFLVLLFCLSGYGVGRALRRAKLGFAFSNVAPFVSFKKSSKWALWHAKEAFFWVALFCFCLPFANLSYSGMTRKGALFEMPQKGIAIYCLVDRSSSMGEEIEGASKLNSAKKILHDWIDQRKNDLIGLSSFARGSQILAPLTLEKPALFEKLQTIEAAKTPEEDGTEIGYAIFKTVNLILDTRHFAERLQKEKEPSYTIQNSVLIVLTDGLENPNPLDKDHPLRFMRTQEALKFAANSHIKVYFITLLGSEDEAAFLRLTEPIQEACRATGGDFFIARNSFSLEQLYQKIDKLEKSDTPLKAVVLQKKDLGPYAIVVGLILLLFCIVLDTLFVRVLP